VVRFLHWYDFVKKELRLLINRNDTVKRKTEFSLIYHLNFFRFICFRKHCMIVVHWYTCFFMENEKKQFKSCTVSDIYFCYIHLIFSFPFWYNLPCQQKMLGLHLKMYNVPQSRKLHFILIYVLFFWKLFVFNLDIFAVYRANNLCPHVHIS
jgi:hypothetical protein